MSFLLKGKKAVNAYNQAEAAAEKAKAEAGKMYRYWVPVGVNDASITFVDGNLNEEGLLDIPMFREHRLFINGSWSNFFICTSDIEPCPICADGDNPDLVGVLTVIDHKKHVSKDGSKTYVDTPRLFVAKRTTIKTLQTLATKRNGLAGCRFDVYRTEDKQAAVGSTFDFESKTPVDTLRKKYVQKDPNTSQLVTYFIPADYEKELVYRDAETLRKLGFGKLTGSIGSEPPFEADVPEMPPPNKNTKSPDYSSML